jgi:c-di-AMP phosphodiesterase-like protein
VINPKNPSTGLISSISSRQTDFGFLQKGAAPPAQRRRILMIDNFEVILQNAKEMEKSQRPGPDGTKKVSQWAEKKTGPWPRNTTATRYLFVMEEPYLKEMIAERFPVLEMVIRKYRGGPQ